MENKQKKPMNLRALKSGSYSLIISAVALVLVVLVNLFVNALPSSYTKPDTSTVGLLNISEETKEVVGGITEPVTMYLIAPSGGEDAMILELLNRYADLSSLVTVKTVDPDLQPAFVTQYTEEAVTPSSVIVVSDKRSFVIDSTDIYVTSYENITEEEYYYYIYYGVMPQGTPYFNGELMLSSAVDYVTSEYIPTLYTLSGHSEDALSASLSAYLETDNVNTAELSLLSEKAVPDDATAVFINNPKTDISVYESELLRGYLQSGGNMILITDVQYYSGASMPNLTALAALMGMKPEDGLLVEGNSSNYNGYPHYLLPVLGTEGPAQLMGNASAHTFMPMCHGIVLDESSDAQPHTLLQTTLSSYVKKDFPNMTTGEMEEGDVQGSFSVAASSTRAAETGESKLVWYASPAIINDQWDYYVGGTNSALFMASVNWMCEKTTSLSILAKQMQIEPLVVPEASVNMWTIILIVAVPVAFLGSGFYVWFRRRRR